MDRPSPERGEEHKRHTDGDWCRSKTTDCSLMAADADIFIQLAQLTVIKENETLRLVCRGRRRKKKKKTKRRDQRVSSVTFSDQQASSFLVTNRHSNTHSATTHTFWLTGTHINISAAQKLHFLPSFTSCILNIIFQRKSLNVWSLLGTERSYLDYRLRAISKNWILSLIAVMC